MPNPWVLIRIWRSTQLFSGLLAPSNYSLSFVNALLRAFVRSHSLSESALFGTLRWSLALPLFCAVNGGGFFSCLFRFCFCCCSTRLSLGLSLAATFGYIRNVLCFLQLVAFETLSSFVMLANYFNKIQNTLYHDLCVFERSSNRLLNNYN